MNRDHGKACLRREPKALKDLDFKYTGIVAAWASCSRKSGRRRCNNARRVLMVSLVNCELDSKKHSPSVRRFVVALSDAQYKGSGHRQAGG